MDKYRLYPLNSHGRIAGPPFVIEQQTDQDAIAEAQTYERVHPVELWKGTTLIYRTDTPA